MIADLTPYPEMKDSGVPWLGSIPAGWGIRRLKTVFREVDRRSTTGTETLLSLRMQQGLVDHHATGGRPIPAESLVGYKLTEPGEIVMNRMRAAAGLFAATPSAGIVSPDYAVLRPIVATELDYYVHLFRTPLMMSIFRLESTGLGTGESGFLRLYTERFGMLPTLIPPRSEQVAIVRFLDCADQRIRRYIQAKQRMIKLLEEQKQAIIHRAVTRGLDPSVHLKPSGVRWLGDVPDHWTVAALRLRYAQCLGKMLDSKRIRGVHTLPYLRNTDVQWDRVNTAKLPVMDIAPNEYERYAVKPGDLLICEGGEVGRAAIWNGELKLCGFQKALHRLRPLALDRDVPRFLLYVFRAASKGGAFDDGHESTIAHLTGDKLRAHRFLFPPESEQRAIVAHLDHRVQEIERGARSANCGIALLREYRTRLVTDVVTGKLDVREAAAALRDEAHEPEPFDDTAAFEADDPESDAAPEEDEA
jgi:type I restriction enzyme S subunit